MYGDTKCPAPILLDNGNAALGTGTIDGTIDKEICLFLLYLKIEIYHGTSGLTFSELLWQSELTW